MTRALVSLAFLGHIATIVLNSYRRLRSFLLHLILHEDSLCLCLVPITTLEEDLITCGHHSVLDIFLLSSGGWLQSTGHKLK